MKTKDKTTKAILKDIESGKYRNLYLMYTRKSEDEADSQKNSIEYQIAENSRCIAKSTGPIAPITLPNFCRNGVISERHSGFKESDELDFSKDGKIQYHIDRPKFLQMLQYVNAGHFAGIICLSWDRISRNKSDDAVLRKLMRRGIDIRFSLTEYDDSSSGELHMDVDGMFAQHHSRVTSEKIRAVLKKSREAGLCTYLAPIGYLNQGNMDHKPIDPERGPIITELFKLYADGGWSLADLARHANDQNMTTVPKRRRRTKEELLAQDEVKIEKISRPISKTNVGRILRNRFYTGRVLNNDGNYIQSNSHDALIDDATFDYVQNKLNGKNVSLHYTEKLDHPMRGLIRCADCNRAYTPYVKKGILYFYVRCDKQCSNSLKSINFEFVSDLVKQLIDSLHFTDDELAKLEVRTGTEIALLEEKRNTESERIERSRKRVREDLAYLRINRLELLKSGVYTPTGIVEEQSKLEDEFDSLLDKDFVSEQAMRETMKEITTLSELLKLSVPLYENADPRQKEKTARTVFSELFVSQNTLSYNLNRGFEAFANRKDAMCAPIAWLSELYAEREYIKASIATLQNPTA